MRYSETTVPQQKETRRVKDFQSKNRKRKIQVKREKVNRLAVPQSKYILKKRIILYKCGYIPYTCIQRNPLCVRAHKNANVIKNIFFFCLLKSTVLNFSFFLVEIRTVSTGCKL